MAKRKFKVGDLVDFRPGYCEGEVWAATISSVDEKDDMYPYEVDLGDRFVWAFAEELEPGKVRVDAGPRTL